MTALEKGIAIHERLAALMQGDSVPMSDAWGELFDDLKRLSETSQPVAHTETCEITNMLATGLYLRGFPTPEQGRNIPLYLQPQHNPALVSFPRITFKPAEDERYRIIMRGDEQVGTIYHWNDGGLYFIDIPGHCTGDLPGFKSEALARNAARDRLDKPA